jgi:DNA-directed RNA polymerase I subunit RPA2
MRAGMLVESMAGKSGAVHGMFQDATPFRFHEEQKVIDYVGEQLRYV